MDNERRKQTNRSRRCYACELFFFFVSMRTHLRETMTKKRRARARTRGGGFFFSKTRFKTPLFTPSPLLRARAHWWNRVRKTALRSVAVYRRRRRVAFFKCFKVCIYLFFFRPLRQRVLQCLLRENFFAQKGVPAPTPTPTSATTREREREERERESMERSRRESDGETCGACLRTKKGTRKKMCVQRVFV